LRSVIIEVNGVRVTVLEAPTVVQGSRSLSPGWVAFESGTIIGAGRGRAPSDLGPPTTLGSGTLAAGLVDMQINGAYGVDFAAATEQQWAEVAAQLAQTGCTAFVPTFITASIDNLVTSVARYRQLSLPAGGAQPIGIHLEGPFLSERRRGAHRAELLVDPTPDRLSRLVQAAGPDLRYVTLAPERSGALPAVRALRAAGVDVAIGHSDADHETVFAAVDAGASLVTHLFNAQRPLGHRDPGVVGAALVDERLTLGLIADLHHVDATAVKVAFNAAAGRIALVTDAVAAMGMPPGQYELGGDTIDIAGSGPALRPDGTIAGSAVRIDEVVGNAVSCGVDRHVALDAATRVPAEAMRRRDLGRIEVGARADLVWLDDSLRAASTWVAGECVFTAGARR
jgi:N-acetylglucosamine-6-phosphate deacetylase